MDVNDLLKRGSVVTELLKQDHGTNIVLEGQDFRVVKLVEVIGAINRMPAAEGIDAMGPFPEFKAIEGAAGADGSMIAAVRRHYRDREAMLKNALDKRDWEIKQLKAKIKGVA